MLGQAPIFTSNAAGDSDSFVLVYNVNLPQDLPGGQYRTQIRFTAEPVNPQAGASQSTVILDVVIDIRATFSVTIKNARGTRELDLGHISKDRLLAADALKIDIESNTAPYTISQQLTEPLTSAEGQVIDESDFNLLALGGDKGVLVAKGVQTPVSASQQRLYASQTGAGDNLVLQYTVAPQTTQKAGIYHGTLAGARAYSCAAGGLRNHRS